MPGSCHHVMTHSVRPGPPCRGTRLVLGPSEARSHVRTRNDAESGSVTSRMTTIGFIGSGHVGGTVARLAVDAGHDVVLSNSRGPETLEDLADDLGPRARAATGEDAAEAGDLVVVSVPLVAVERIPAELLRGKVVLDTCNYYPQRDGHVAELDDETTTTSELVQRHLAGSTVVKVFSNIN